MKEKLENKKGITLIALMITIIIMLILVGVTISLTLNGGILDTAREAVFKQELIMIKEEYRLYLKDKQTEDMEFEEEKLYIYKDNYRYGEEKVEGASIKTAIANIPRKYEERIEIIKGELYYISQNEKELKWAQEIGVLISPYKTDEKTGNVLLSNGTNLFLVDENGRLVIPETVKGKPITEIGEGAFANVEGLREIVIPGTVKKIGQGAFRNNPTLEKVIIENGVETIGNSAFAECRKLKTVEMKDSVTTLGHSIFNACINLENITLSNNIETISAYTFNVCRNLKEINLPRETKYLRSYSFGNCTSLKTVRIGKNIETIDPTAFRACSSLENIEIDAENNNFASENGILFNKTRTEMIYISKAAISGNTFVVPETVTKLSSGLLTNYSQITKVIIPANVTAIDNNFFANNVNQITIDEKNPKYVVSNGGIYNKEKTELCYYFANEPSVKLEEGITTIKAKAFIYSNKVTNLILPESLTTIDSQSLMALKQESINIGKNVSNINPMAFYSSNGIKTLIIDPENPNYTFENGALYNKDKTKLIKAGLRYGSIEEFIIPEGVTEIGDYAFHNQNKMTKVTIPETVKKIGGSFQYCRSLTKIEIPKSVESISTTCFSSSESLKEVIIHKAKGSIAGVPWGATIGERAIIWKED